MTFIRIAQYPVSSYDRVESAPRDDIERTRRRANGTWVLARPLHDWLIERGADYRLHWMRDGGPEIVEQYWEVEIISGHDDVVVEFMLRYGI